MTYSPGDPGHMLAHSDLVTAVNAELTRFGMAADLPTRALGDEGHLDDHNAIRGALATIEATAGRTFGTALPPVRNLGDPGHVDDHTALLACALEASTWPAWNAATGGTITEVADGQYPLPGRWRVHTFTAAGSLDISLAVQPFRVLVVGGGGRGEDGVPDTGGGSRGGCGGGAGGVFANDAMALTAQAHAVTVGGQSGQSSVAAAIAEGGQSLSALASRGGESGNPTKHTGGGEGPDPNHKGGGGGAGAGGNGDGGSFAGGGGGAGVPSDITGGAQTYARGGNGGGSAVQPGNGADGDGYGGGGGGGSHNGNGRAGKTGVVIVAYQIG